jgi:hypothetical protein
MIKKALTMMGALGLMAQAALAADGFKPPDLPTSEAGPYFAATVCLAGLCVVAFKNAKRVQQN